MPVQNRPTAWRVASRDSTHTLAPIRLLEWEPVHRFATSAARGIQVAQSKVVRSKVAVVSVDRRRTSWSSLFGSFSVALSDQWTGVVPDTKVAANE